MKDIFVYFLFGVIYILFLIFLFNKDKIYKKIEPYAEKYVWKFIPYGIGYPVLMFLLLAAVKYISNSSDNDFVNQLCIGAIIFYFLAAITSIYELMEKFGFYVSQRTTFSKFLLQIFLSLLSIVLCFGFTYNALYYYDNSMFSSVVNDGIFMEALQFVYYSFEIMFNTEISEIRAVKYLSQGINILESLTSFFVIVILIANYEYIGKLFNKGNKRGRRSITRANDNRRKSRMCDI